MKLLRTAYYAGDERYQAGWWCVVDHGDGKERPHFLWEEREREPDDKSLANLISMIGDEMGLAAALQMAKYGARVASMEDEE